MSIEKAREYLCKCGPDDRIQAFTVSSATVELAAQTLNVAQARIAKASSFQNGDGCKLPEVIA